MTEKKVIIDGIKVKYEGYFVLQELYGIIEKWLEEMKYDQSELAHYMSHKEDGKNVDIVMNPDRSVSDYVKHILKITIAMRGVNDVVLDVDGKKRRVQEGKVSITIKGVQYTDYESKWVGNAFSYFVRTIVDKYLYANYITDFEALLEDQAKNLYNEISTYLNTNKYRFTQKDRQTVVGQHS